MRSQGFSSVHQTPLLLNPSFAGSTGASRFAVATNFGNTRKFATQNNYFSFDHLLKKTGIGLGAALYTYKSGDGNFINELYSKGLSEGNFKYQTIGGSLSIAPKYVLNKRDGSKRATFSPSLGFSYSQSDINRRLLDYSNTYESPILSFEGPIIDYFSKNFQFNKETIISAGLLYNSEKLIFGIVFSNMFIEKNFETYKVYNDSTSKVYNTSWFSNSDTTIITTDSSYYTFAKQFLVRQSDREIKASIQTLDFHLSKIIKIGSSKLSITPSLNFGISHLQHKDHPSYPKFRLYKANLFLQLNYGKVFLGGGMTSVFSSYCAFAGYKNDRLKLMASYNFSNSRSFVKTQIIELSVNYNLKFKKR